MKKPIILCVDDEQVILNALNSQLKGKFGRKYRYEFAESGLEAMELIEDLFEEGQEVIMVISDQIMPGMAGDQLLVQVHQSYPKPIKLLLTGQSSMESAINAINQADLYRYLNKPWDEEDFLLTVEKGLQRYFLMESLESQVQIFRKFVPYQFLECLNINDFEEIKLAQAKKMNLSVLFGDIRKFTALSEKMTPEEDFKFLNNYFSRMTKHVNQNGGFIDKYIGDEIMALFAGSVSDAVQAAVDMKKELFRYNMERRRASYPPIRVGIGVNSGELVLGTIGSDDRIDSTVVGQAVNIASRLEGLTKFYQVDIIISESIYEGLKSKKDFLIRELDFVRVYGKEKPIKIYEVIVKENEGEQEKIQGELPLYQKALSLYRNREWEASSECFADFLQKVPEDPVSILYQKYCTGFLQSPPLEDWDGSIIFHSK